MSFLSKWIPFQIHPKGQSLVYGLLGATIIALLIFPSLMCLLAIATLYCGFSFRDPKRIVPQSSGMVLSAVDGIVTNVTSVPLPDILGEGLAEGDYHCVTIETRPHYARVNRIPVSGKVLREMYTPARGVNLSVKKGHPDTEHEVVAIQTEKEEVVAFSLRGYVIPNQVITQLYEGDSVELGQRCGMMRCGGQCKIYVPAGYKLMIGEGSSTIAGETIIGVDTPVFKPSKLEWKAS